jgi:hypothetical protein
MTAWSLRDADDAAWLEYADGLLERGDVRGEHILEELRGGPACRDEELLLSPELLELSNYWRFTFRRTFIHSATLGGPPEDPAPVAAIHALRRDPAAALLERLTLTTAPAILDAVLADPPAVRCLAIGSPREWTPGLRVGPEGTPARVAIPTLEELWTCSTSLPALLRGEFELPALESLTWIPDTGDALFAPASVLSRPPARLVSLRLMVGRVRSHAFVASLARSPLATQLRNLDLGILDDDARAVLLASAGEFPRLERAGFTAAGTPRSSAEVADHAAAFATAFPRVRFDVQWGPLTPQGQTGLRPETDTASRRADGRVDAIAHFVSRSSRRH